MSAITLVLLIWLLAAVAMLATWLLALRTRNIGYVDVVWAGAMAVSALLAGSLGSGGELPRMLVAMFGGVWGARLCLHLLRRVLREEEDGRYQALRAAWQGDPRKLFVFFQMQALVVAVFSIPFVAAAASPGSELDGWMIAAIVVWIVSLAGESLADAQLARFREDGGNTGLTCRRGLWAWSRHP
ncbi:MAG TPA: DUF1295 domain-containing protein, partial [Arenimonas sp.]|nr:DUF1295 domain-containing protein [Arenimonas sp.]